MPTNDPPIQGSPNNATPMRVPRDAQEPKKHQHGWECFKYSGALIMAPMSVEDQVELIYKTAYRTGYKNAVEDQALNSSVLRCSDCGSYDIRPEGE